MTLIAGVIQRDGAGRIVTATTTPPPDNLSDVPMIARYECWRETVVADGTAQSQATDWSGNGNHATQATGSKQPLYKTSQINGLPVWRFDGVGDVLVTGSLPAMNNTQTRWYFFVLKMLATPNVVNGFFVGANTANSNSGDMHYFLNNVEQQIYSRYVYGAAGMDNRQTGLNQGTTIFRLHSLVLQGAGILNRVKIGPNIAYSSSVIQQSGAINGTFTLLLGDILPSSTTSGANCDIAAFFMGNGPVDAALALRIEAYFLRVYGLTA